MTNTNNTFTIGATVARRSKGASTGRTGQIIELNEDQVRVHWTKKSKGEPMSQRSWINSGELMVVAKPVITVDELAFIAWKNELAAKYAAWMTASDAGTLRDDDNPAFLFQGVPTKLLAMIVKGEINAAWLAGKEMANRGMDKDGLWVGFDKAEEIHGTKFIK